MLLAFLVMSPAFIASQAQKSHATPQDGYIRASRLGITFISSADHAANDGRYQRALLLGAGWNRWPLYWQRVETATSTFNWAAYDRLVNDDLRHGLQVNAILIGIPAFYQAGNSIAGLRQSIFTDGSDEPGPTKRINPANPWANFVYQAVQRYKPGGGLAQEQGWPSDWGVRVWEAWNEPDVELFWKGGVEEYARLLKVTYLAVHVADPQAQVMVGGLAGDTDDDGKTWLTQMLDIFAKDPLRKPHNWFVDLVGIHSYSYARLSGLAVGRVVKDLKAFDLERPVWLNESGVPTWDDYPGPTWATGDASLRRFMATMQQQAAYIVQSTAYAWAEGADVVFFHQLYDDCNDRPAGTNFPPNNGELCKNGDACWGHAFGLYRNDPASICFSQHPQPDTPRPAAAAYRLLAEVFGQGAFGKPSIKTGETSVLIKFERGDERIYVFWNRTLDKQMLDIPARGIEGRYYTLDRNGPITPAGGVYRVDLPPAVRDDYPWLRPGDVSGIGGQPFVLVEKAIPIVLDPAIAPLATLANQPLIPLRFTPTPSPTLDPLVTPSPTATLDISRDKTPPVTAMRALPPISPATFTVSWSARDDLGIDYYLVWVRVNGGEWKPWLETRARQGQYTGESGNTYEFAVWARDVAGKWSENTDLKPQAVTKVP
jgi:hypothetical protein